MKLLLVGSLVLRLVVATILSRSSHAITSAHDDLHVLNRRAPMQRFPGATRIISKESQRSSRSPSRSLSPSRNQKPEDTPKEWKTKTRKESSRSTTHPVRADATLHGPAEIVIHHKNSHNANRNRPEEHHVVVEGQQLRKSWTDPHKLKISGAAHPPNGKLHIESQGRKMYTQLSAPNNAVATTSLYSGNDGMVSAVAQPKAVVKGSSHSFEHPAATTTLLQGGSLRVGSTRHPSEQIAGMHQVLSNSPSHSPDRQRPKFPIQHPRFKF